MIHLPTPQDKPSAVLPQTTSGFAKGNCTSWVALKRAIAKNPVTWHGNANMWAVNAKKQGYVISSNPRPGSIYVAKQESSHGSSMGHVAFVEKVVGDKYLVSEMNVKGLGKVSTRWLSTTDIPKKGISFIY